MKFKAIIFLICMLGFSSAFAITLGTDSPKIKLSIAPGESKSGIIQVNNAARAAAQVSVYAQDWLYKSEGDGNKNFSAPSSTPLSCAAFIHLSPTQFELQPDEIGSINYTVTLPGDAVGGYYGVIFFETDMGMQELNGASVKVRGRVGSLVYIEAEGTVNRSSEITQVSVVPPQEGNPLKINVEFINQGNVDVTAKGTFHIIDQNGNIYARDALRDIYTLPGDKVRMTTEWSGALNSGEYDVILTYDLGHDQSIVKETKVVIP